MNSLRIIFAGTPEFAVPALAALADSSHQVSLVLTQPDRPAGRGMKLKASPVKVLAEQKHIPVLQPETLKDAEIQARLAAEQADVFIVAAYGLIIPKGVLDMPRLGCYNIHASLLPRWRGAAPIQRSLLAGDAETGVTIMEVVPALDAGNMIHKRAFPISEHDTAQSLHDSLASIGAELMLESMNELATQGTLPSQPQDEALMTYAAKLQKAEATIDWSQDAVQISRKVRAFNPFPVAQARLQDEICRIWFATHSPGKASPGEVISLDDSILVGCGEGLLRIEELQMPGGKRLSARQFLAGHPLQVGDYFS